MQTESWMPLALEELRAQQLERELQVMPDPADGAPLLNFASNDYLNLARDPRVTAAAADALRRWGAGAGASRLVSGTWECHARLEQTLARLKGRPAALAFGSGFLASLGTVAALVDRGDRVVADRLAHASLLDGARLSRAELRRFQHNDVDHLVDCLRRAPAARRTLVVTESVFSMDGDRAPLAAIAAASQAHGAMLLVDEAHATGVWGPGGAGCVCAGGAPDGVTVALGTLSKALGAYGGFVAGSDALRRWLINRARAFIFSTALPPACAGAALGALDCLARHPGMGAELLRRAAVFRARLRDAGLDTGRSESQIVPLMVGDCGRALALARRLRGHGILAVAIRPPTVPAGTARLRLSVTLAHTPEALTQAADTIIAAAREQGLPEG